MKEFFCRLFTPWRAGAQFDAPEAFYGFLLARNKLLGIIRNLCFGAALVLLIVGYAVSDGTSGYSIADIANQPFYLIAVGVMVIALLLAFGLGLFIFLVYKKTYNGVMYSASFGTALIAMTKSVAYSFADRGVRVNAVAPGVVNTDMVANMPQFAKDSVGDTIPMKRFAEPEDIANGILFLSSSSASYVTGVCLQIDGGYRPNNLPK